MRRNNAGFGLANKILTIVAILLIVAAIAVPNLSKKTTPDIELHGWVRNVNVVVASDTTYIAFEKDGDITPQSYELAGGHPELWPGEHVWLKLHLFYGNRYEIVGFKRLGPDALDKSERSPSSP